MPRVGQCRYASTSLRKRRAQVAITLSATPDTMMMGMETDTEMSLPSEPLCEAIVEQKTSDELEARLTDLSEQLAGKPLKHIIPKLRNGKHPGTIKFVAAYDRNLQRSKELRKEIQREIRHEKRIAEQAAPATAIETDRRRRLSMLARATKHRGGDKLLEQLLGREKELSLFWAAAKLAALEVRSRAPTDKEVAIAFTKLTGEPCTKDQARGRRKILAKLNELPGVWLPLEAGSRPVGCHSRG